MEIFIMCKSEVELKAVLDFHRGDISDVSELESCELEIQSGRFVAYNTKAMENICVSINKYLVEISIPEESNCEEKEGIYYTNKYDIERIVRKSN